MADYCEFKGSGGTGSKNSGNRCSGFGYAVLAKGDGGGNSGNGNTGVGCDALRDNRSGERNTAVGHGALANNKTGSYNVALGVDAIQHSLGTSYNTCVGYFSGVSNEIETGYGTALGLNATAHDNATAIGANAFTPGPNTVMLGDSECDVFTENGYYFTSDGRDKADVRDTHLGLDFILKLRPVDFRWNKRTDYTERKRDLVTKMVDGEEVQMPVETLVKHPMDGSKKRKRYHHGFIAQEIGAMPEAFGGFQNMLINGFEDKQALNYSELIAPMVKAMQEQQQILAAQKKEIAALKSMMETLMTKAIVPSEAAVFNS